MTSTCTLIKTAKTGFRIEIAPPVGKIVEEARGGGYSLSIPDRIFACFGTLSVDVFDYFMVLNGRDWDNTTTINIS